ncbi:MAG: AzlD domain-containing protein [Anaerolineaceae bacterium]|nr:AzlD domain-containing protein [Anaerolineaceae bacterium]
MNEFALIVGMLLVTFIPRYGVMALLGRVELPGPVFRALRFVPPAVLSAIILPAVLLNGEQGSLNLALTNSYLVAGIVAGVVAWRSKNVLLTIVLGMAFLWAWRWLLLQLGA